MVLAETIKTSPNEKAMLIKTLLNKVERFKPFIYGTVYVNLGGEVEALVPGTQKGRSLIEPLLKTTISGRSSFLLPCTVNWLTITSWFF